jgi:hypothetical protein
VANGDWKSYQAVGINNWAHPLFGGDRFHLLDTGFTHDAFRQSSKQHKACQYLIAEAEGDNAA